MGFVELSIARQRADVVLGLRYLGFQTFRGWAGGSLPQGSSYPSTRQGQESPSERGKRRRAAGGGEGLGRSLEEPERAARREPTAEKGPEEAKTGQGGAGPRRPEEGKGRGKPGGASQGPGESRLPREKAAGREVHGPEAPRG